MIKFMRVNDIVKACHISKATLYTRIQSGMFPAPIKLGGIARNSVWVEAEIEKLLNAQVRGDNDDQIKALVIRMTADRKKLKD